MRCSYDRRSYREKAEYARNEISFKFCGCLSHKHDDRIVQYMSTDNYNFEHHQKREASSDEPTGVLHRCSHPRTGDNLQDWRFLYLLRDCSQIPPSLGMCIHEDPYIDIGRSRIRSSSPLMPESLEDPSSTRL